MNKIYNNLNIENLTKTDWLNQFDKYQQKEIMLGIKSNVDVSIYAKIDFTWQQMQKIRFGLLENLDVSIYANIEYNANQMEIIRLGLKDNLDVSFYNKTYFD